MGAHIHFGKLGQNGPVIAALFNPNMSNPPTGKLNGLLAKGSIQSSDPQGPLTGHPLYDLVYLTGDHGAYVNIIYRNTKMEKFMEISWRIGSFLHIQM